MYFSLFFKNNNKKQNKIIEYSVHQRGSEMLVFKLFHAVLFIAMVRGWD